MERDLQLMPASYVAYFPYKIYFLISGLFTLHLTLNQQIFSSESHLKIRGSFNNAIENETTLFQLHTEMKSFLLHGHLRITHLLSKLFLYSLTFSLIETVILNGDRM